MTQTAPDIRASELRTKDRRRWTIPQEWGLVAGILVVLAVIYYIDRQHAFFQGYSIQTLFHRLALFGVLALGAAVVIISGGIDLSTGSVVALSSVVSAKLLTDWLRPAGASGAIPPSVGLVALAIGITLLMGLAIGLFHAMLITWIRLPPFIATLATMAGLRSVAIVIARDHTITVTYGSFRVLGNDYRVALGIFAAVAVTLAVVMGRTVLGRHIYAMGGNEAAARLSGLRTNRLKAIVYGLSAALSALGGILFCGLNGQGDSHMGLSYELIAITAAVVGGCSLSGGAGTILGTILGLLLTQIVIKGTGQVTPAGINSTSIEGFVLGTVVILAVAFNQLFRTRRE